MGFDPKNPLSLRFFCIHQGDGSLVAQAAADVVVAAHTEDGVAEAVERYVLEGTGGGWMKEWNLRSTRH